MSEETSFTDMVRSEMSDLISDYRLSLQNLDESNVFLKGTLYALRVSLDRDGVAVVYFDTSDKECAGYNVFLYLFNKRHSSLRFPDQVESETKDQFIREQIKILKGHIRISGRDILSGEKDWLNDYLWPKVSADAATKVFLSGSTPR